MPSIFPLTETVSDEDRKIVNETILADAHEFIRSGHSPYEAWMMASLRDIADMPDVMGLSDEECEELMDFPLASPPALHVLRFCTSVGVHPAHLLPDENAPKYLDHYFILEAIKDLARPNPKKEVLAILSGRALSGEDYYKCLTEFQNESRKMGGFNPRQSSFLGKIVKGIKGLSVQPQDGFDLPSLETPGLHNHFNRKVGSHASDVDLVVDQYSEFLKQKTNAAKNMSYNAEHDLQDLLETMNDLGEVLFGEERAERIVKYIADTIYNDPEYKTLTKEFRTVAKYMLIAENLDPDYRVNALVSFQDPKEITSKLSRAIDTYIEKRDACLSAGDDFSKAERQLEKFTKWKESFEGSRQLRSLCNYMLIRPFLSDNTKSLPAPEASNTGFDPSPK